MVSVESGIGWIPFILETMDYELWENAPTQAAEMPRKPSEYFKNNWYATFWFERANGDLQPVVDAVGEDNIFFETDFPHPTCLYPDPLGRSRTRCRPFAPSPGARSWGTTPSGCTASRPVFRTGLVRGKVWSLAGRCFGLLLLVRVGGAVAGPRPEGG